MPAYKDKEKGTWYASFYYEDWTGKKVKKLKRGFSTKRDALEWERTFLQQQTADLEMTFENFVALYAADMKGRIKENTWGTKEHILYKKLVPYFGKRKMCDIHSKEIMAWQNEMLNHHDENGKPYSPVYLKTLHNQLSAVFNHAVRHYGLKVNPAAQVGNMGKAKGREMLFWTKAEYLKFADVMMDKPLSYYAFEMLYWCGVREGELLALTAADFDFEKQTVTISKSYQRIKGRDVITDPKTPKSNRVIQMPAFLCDEMQDCIKSLYAVQPTDRIFTVTKSYLHREMDRGAKEAGVKRIRIHDLRHSHISLLIDMGFTALAIADRVGHESIDITYRYAHLFPTRQTEMANKLDKVGNMGKAKAREMLFWTQEEYKKFSEEMMDKPVSFYAFEMLYWCGIREGELLALTPADFDFERQTVTINKSYQRIGGRDIITDPKTPKSNRTIKMPEFLCEEMQDYITRRLTHRDVVVQGNPRVFKALRNQLAEVLSELQRIETGGVANDELLDLIEMIADILGGMKEESE